MPLLIERDNNQTLIVALKTANLLIENESSHEHIIGVGKPIRKGDH